MKCVLLLATVFALSFAACTNDGPADPVNELPELPSPRDLDDGSPSDVEMPETDDLADSDGCVDCPSELIDCPDTEFADLAAAHWVSEDLVAITTELDGAAAYELWLADCGLNPSDLQSADRILELSATGTVPVQVAEIFPHLAENTVLSVPSMTPAELDNALQGQLLLVALDSEGDLLTSSRVQTTGLLDARFAVDAPLGPIFSDDSVSVAVWAPTARWVRLCLYDPVDQRVQATVAMIRDHSGVWTASEPQDEDWNGLLYQFEVYAWDDLLGRYPNQLDERLVTDPWSTALSVNSQFSVLVDLESPTTRPTGWETLTPPGTAATESIIYELHVRDFSASDDSVPPPARGGYAAFLDAGGAEPTQGMSHLEALAVAGVTHLQLLPVFDFATVNEDPDQRVDLDDPFSALCAINAQVPDADCEEFGDTAISDVLDSFPETSAEQQRITALLAPHDSFNWGYDPLHFGVPEGSYATDPHGAKRIREFRSMILSLAQLGLAVSLDMVFNHTHASGRTDSSILDRIVPGYYHRRDPVSGDVLTSTCCQNTATEHAMMRKLMVDLVVRWAVQYKIQGFRFDLMGHHMVADMEAVRSALDQLEPEEHGIDGSSILLYGEGWDFGEVANNARGVNASQTNLAGSGIGTFNDRIRDALRGGGPFDTGAALRSRQGFANGLHVDRNALAPAGVTSRQALQTVTDRLRASVTGNLQTLVFEDTAGRLVAGGNLRPLFTDVAYALTPADSIQYVAAHDNQTLWDIQQLKLPSALPTSARVRMQNLASSIVLLSQGVPFLHAGQELLRSKSMARDSYDSGDWFNALHLSGNTNGQQRGLPPEEDDGPNWNIILSVFADPTTDVGPVSISGATTHLHEFLEVRKSSPLFRLQETEEVETRLHFLQPSAIWQPGVLAWSITDGNCAGIDLDPLHDGVVVVANSTPDLATVSVPGLTGFELHESLDESADETVTQASFVGGSFSVPGRTVAVFTVPDGTDGGGLLCNPYDVSDIVAMPTAPLYVRGTMTDWAALEFAALATRSAMPNVASVDLYLEAGAYEFKIATADWNDVDLGGTQAVVNGGSVPLQPGSGNAAVTIPEEGLYRFSLSLPQLPESGELTIVSLP